MISPSTSHVIPPALRSTRSPRVALAWLASLAALVLLLGGAAPACRKAQAKTRGVGDELRAFIIKNCANGRQYCQICEFSGKATIMAVADWTDESFEEDLVRIQKLVDAHGAEGLAAFAVLGTMKDGKLDTPPDEAKAIESLKAMRERLGLSIPVVVLPRDLTDYQKKNYTPFNDAYEIVGSRTILFAPADGKILFADRIRPGDAEKQFASLEDAIARSL